jgi:hypothetical protein
MTEQPANPTTQDTNQDDDETMSQTMLEARVTACPIKPCRGGDDDGYYIRDVRTDRHLCHYCAVASPTGYIGRDTAKQMDDRYFQGGYTDYAISFGVMLAGSIVANALTLFLSGLVGFFAWIIAAIIGSGGGTYISRYARQMTGRRVGRYSAEVALAGILIGALLAPTAVILVRVGVFAIVPEAAFNIVTLICTGVMGYTAWGIFKRKI